jgi:hypothetical protein
MTGAIYFWGYGGSRPSDLLRVVHRLRITHVIDCRRRPRSRVPGWSAGSITAALAVGAPGVTYLLRGEDLGGYPPGTEIPDPPPPVSEDALNSLQAAACVQGERLLLICAEKAPAECHRHMTIGLPLARKAKAEPMWWPDDVVIRHVYEGALIEPMELQASIDEGRDYHRETLEDEAPPPPAGPLAAYRYYVLSADDAGEQRHPQIVIREHFPDSRNFKPFPAGATWLFEAAPREGVPGYFVRLPDEPAAEISGVS